MGFRGCTLKAEPRPRTDQVFSDPVFRHLPGHRITVNPEQVGRLPDAAFRALQGAGDKHFLELLTGVVVAHAPVEHFLHERFELFAHGYCNSRPDRSR